MNMSDSYDSENHNIHNSESYENMYKMTEKEFYEIQEEYRNEDLYAEENKMDTMYWCKACKIGICMNPYHE